jgi:putative transposase
VAADEHFFSLLRYVERNALRANLVGRAEEWRWGSLWRRSHPDSEPAIALADWPLPRPSEWIDYVNRPETEAELEALRRSVSRSAPYGPPAWQRDTARRLGLAFTLRPRGRPRKPMRNEPRPLLPCTAMSATIPRMLSIPMVYSNRVPGAGLAH